MSDIVKDATLYRIKQIELAEAEYYKSLVATLDSAVTGQPVDPTKYNNKIDTSRDSRRHIWPQVTTREALTSPSESPSTSWEMRLSKKARLHSGRKRKWLAQENSNRCLVNSKRKASPYS